MSRPHASSPDERLRVRVLAQEGFSQRWIAERVFGDRRHHGRVERILKRAPEGPRLVVDDPAELSQRLETLLSGLEGAELLDIEELVDLYWRRSVQRRLEEAPETVKLSELSGLLKLEMRLENLRQYRRFRYGSGHAPAGRACPPASCTKSPSVGK